MEKYLLKSAPKGVFALLLLLIPLLGYGWGVKGHQTIALIAQSQLTPATRATIDRLLAQEPGSSLMSISTWSDEHRDGTNTRWHYINFPRGDCHYQKQRDCPDGQCVIEAIKTQRAIFHSTAPDTDKLLALKFLVHLVGDIHQPLHAGFGDDRGGNTYQVQYRTEGTNLHAIWDNAMLEQFGRNPVALANFALSDRSLKKPFPSSDVVGWAEQSCAIVSAPGFYPGHLVTEDYMEEYAPVAELQILRAGFRLAALLNSETVAK
jgi:hypothetical protein